MNEDYLFIETPDKLVENGYPHAVMVDGKDVAMGKKLNDGTANRVTWSSKTECDAARCLTWSSAVGLVFEHTPLFCARASENKLQRLWGSLGRRRAPVEEWKDIAKTSRGNSDIHYSALDNMMSFSEFEVLVNEISDNLLCDDDVTHDDVLVTGTPSGLDCLGLLETINGEDDDEFSAEQIAARKGKPIVSQAKKWFMMRKALKAAENLEKGKGGDK